MFWKIVAKPTNVTKRSMDDEAVFLRKKGVLEAIHDVKDADGESSVSCKVEGESESDGADGRGPGMLEVDALLLVGPIGAHASNKLIEIFTATFDLWGEDDRKDLAIGRHIFNWLRSGAQVDELIFVILVTSGFNPKIPVLCLEAFPKSTRRKRRLGKVSNVSKTETNHGIENCTKSLVISEPFWMNNPAKLNRDPAMIVGELEAFEIFYRTSGGQRLIIVDRNDPAPTKVVMLWDLVEYVVVGVDPIEDRQHVILISGEGEAN